MRSFAAIDFETANEQRSSVCSVGVVIVRDGEITDSFYSLVRPEPEYYNYRNIMVHGINYNDTIHAPIFQHVWCQIEPMIEGLPNYKLNTVSTHCGFLLKSHHHALADAEACARIAMQIFN